MNTNFAPILLDFYKASHRQQYLKGTELVFSNHIARKSRVKGVDKVVFVGLQYWIKKYVLELWNEHFFNQPKEVVVKEYTDFMEQHCPLDDYSHMSALHDLGYLPIEIWAVNEGVEVPIGVPMQAMFNTHDDFEWVTNMLETIYSTTMWKPVTSATTALQYRRNAEKQYAATGAPSEFISWAHHNFSMRGCGGVEDAQLVDLGHLVNFYGTDTAPGIALAKKYYNDVDFIAGSVVATEHSCMSSGIAIIQESLESQGKWENRFGTVYTSEFLFKGIIDKDNYQLAVEKAYILTLMQVYPTGILSIVMDTYDFFGVITQVLPSIKDEIMARDGKLVCRPDSGIPEDIICGDGTYYKSFGPEERTHEQKGLIEILWETFGGTTNESGFKVLDPHIGAIYGDAITMERQSEIYKRLIEKKFSVENIVLGIGSYSYVFVTRDTYGQAIKATYVVHNGKGYDTYKEPKTGDGSKKSLRGLFAIQEDWSVKQQVTWEEFKNQSHMTQVFRNGEFSRETTLTEIRERLKYEGFTKAEFEAFNPMYRKRTQD